MSPKASEQSLATFQQQQIAFAAAIRDPEQAELPEGVPAERMAVYQELFYNGLNEQLSSNFPVIHSIMSEADWDAMLRDFLIKHRSQTPLFTEIGLEFLGYLEHERDAPDDHPFMLELAHYEYVELAVSISNADLEPQAEHDPNGDLLSGCPVLAPTAVALSYHYPVHQIRPDNLPKEAPAEPTHLAVYRDRQDDVRFLEVNPVTQHLLSLLQENPDSNGLQLMQQIAEALQHPNPDSVIAAGHQVLLELRERNIILGSRSG